MPPPLPYFKVNICPFPLPHYASIFFAYLWSFRWPNYIVTLPRYFSFRLPHLNIPTGAPSDELDNNNFFLSHYALGTVECDESYCNDGGVDHIWSSGVRGILLPWVILRREGRHDQIWISNFLWRQFRGWGYALIWHMGGVYPYMGTPLRLGFLGWLKCPNIYYSCLYPRTVVSVS
jgi:hypothetical protein